MKVFLVSVLVVVCTVFSADDRAFFEKGTVKGDIFYRYLSGREWRSSEVFLNDIEDFCVKKNISKETIINHYIEILNVLVMETVIDSSNSSAISTQRNRALRKLKLLEQLSRLDNNISKKHLKKEIKNHTDLFYLNSLYIKLMRLDYKETLHVLKEKKFNSKKVFPPHLLVTQLISMHLRDNEDLSATEREKLFRLYRIAINEEYRPINRGTGFIVDTLYQKSVYRKKYFKMYNDSLRTIPMSLSYINSKNRLDSIDNWLNSIPENELVPDSVLFPKGMNIDNIKSWDDL
jgi:hypothetical protein